MFDARSKGDTDIFAVNADGSNLTRLTRTDGWDYLPAWSPGGSRIAYVHGSGGNDDIWTTNADGSDPVRLTDDPALDLDPAWSPDGLKIAFQSDRGGDPEIYVMNADGSGVVNLSQDDRAFDGSAAWSPDGSQIAFASDRDGPGIYVMQSDGSGVRKLTDDAHVGPLEPEWSPDGSRIAYSTAPEGGSYIAINVLDLSSGAVETVTEGFDICCPSWQPLPSEPTPTDGSTLPMALPVSQTRVSGIVGSLAADEGWVWATTYDFESDRAAIDQIDAATGEVVKTIDLPGVASHVAAARGAVWVATRIRGEGLQLLQIDASSGEIVETLPGLTGPVIAAEGAVWAIEDGRGTETVAKIDPRSGKALARTPVQAPFDMIGAAGSIWVTTYGGELIRIDAVAGVVEARIDVVGSLWLAGNERGVWLSDSDSGSAFVDASTNAVESFGRVYNFRPFAVDEDRVWFIAGPHDGGVRGICGIDLTSGVADVCADVVAPDVQFASDPAAFEPRTRTLWAGVYQAALVNRIEQSN